MSCPSVKDLANATLKFNKTVRKAKLKEYSTSELVEELKQREGVEFDELQPYVEKDLGVISGPAIVLTVMD